MSIQLFAAIIFLIFLTNVLFVGSLLIAMEYGFYRSKEINTQFINSFTNDEPFDDHVETAPGMSSPYHG